MLIKLMALAVANLAVKEKAGDRSIHCIHVSDDGHVTATNGAAVLVVAGNVEAPGLFDSEFAVEQREQHEAILIESSTALDFLAACRTKSDDATVVLYRNGAQVDLATTDGVTTKRFLATSDNDPGKFPQIASVLASPDVRQEVTISVDELLKVLRIMKALGAKAVTYGVPSADDANRVILLSAASDVGDVTGGIMPMVK